MANPWSKLRRLLPGDPLQVGTVTALDQAGNSIVELIGGGHRASARARRCGGQPRLRPGRRAQRGSPRARGGDDSGISGVAGREFFTTL